MLKDKLRSFRNVWLVDFEFHQPAGECPQPLCVVAKNLVTGKLVKEWCPPGKRCPIKFGRDDLLVAWFATAELECLYALHSPVPGAVIDLYAEFRRMKNGMEMPSGFGLLGALVSFGLPGIGAAAKADMRDLAIRGGPFSDAEKRELLEYCHSDVVALEHLWTRMSGELDLPRAQIRGDYLVALAHTQTKGIPLDIPVLDNLRVSWPAMREGLICEVDRSYGVYDGDTFKLDRFRAYLNQAGIEWPLLSSGRLALDDATFEEKALRYPHLNDLRQLRKVLSGCHLDGLAVGRDGRNRCLLSPFASTTGRNQPSSTKFIYGHPAAFRSLIKPVEGHALAYIDWSQQEFAIAGCLSEDDNMMEAYRSSDPYLTFAVQAGVAPRGATKESHPLVREQFKACVLGVQYGMGGERLGDRLSLSPAHGNELISRHKATYPRFWRWTQDVQDTAFYHGRLHTTFGWQVQVTPSSRPTSVRNFPVQANGAEMLRLAMICARRKGVTVCAPVHDAMLIEAPINEIDSAVEACQEAMREASELVLPGFPLKTDAKVIKWPERFVEERGSGLWNTLMNLLNQHRQQMN